MTLYIKGTDVQIVGTLEKLQGVALADGLDTDGTIIWHGTTEVRWDDQETYIKDGLPVWVDTEGSIYQDVQVEDRRADGSVIDYAPLANDRLDELEDLMNRVIIRASQITQDEKSSRAELAWAAVLYGHVSNCARGLEKLRKPVIEETVKAHDGYIET